MDTMNPDSPVRRTNAQHVAKPPEPTSTLAALRLLFGKLSARRRRSLLPLLALMLVGAFAELITLGALLPFLAVLADAQGSPIVEEARPLLNAVGATTTQQIQYALTGIFALAALTAAVLRLVLLWASQRFVYGVSCELGVKLYAETLSQNYSYHIRRNSSEIIASIAKVEIATNFVFLPLMTATLAIVLTLFIVVGLIAIAPVVALISGGGYVAIYMLTSFATRSRLSQNASIVAKAQGDRVQSMQEGLGGIRDVLINRSQSVFVEKYERAETDFRDGRTLIALFANAPRFIVEGAGLVLIALIAAALTSRPGGFSEALPVLGALAFGAQKLLPLVQQIYLGWANTMGHRQSLFDVAALLSCPKQPMSDPGPPQPFSSSITINQVGYSYETSRSPALYDISMEIPKGARVGISGKSGSGKSTLIDLIIGLLEPTEGAILVDGVVLTDANRTAWRANIAHVPQAIFLADASIAENIAFGVKMADIEMERVQRAAEQAGLTEVIAQLPKAYKTRVGEHGIQLSGGQRQRIGIARALYKRASVLVLDEATSALDTETESTVMTAIKQLDRDLTVIMIAHRLSTLESCDMVVRLEGGRAWDEKNHD